MKQEGDTSKKNFNKKNNNNNGENKKEPILEKRVEQQKQFVPNQPQKQFVSNQPQKQFVPYQQKFILQQPYSGPQQKTSSVEPMEVDRSTIMKRQEEFGRNSGNQRFMRANILTSAEEEDEKEPEEENLLEEIPEEIIQESDFLD